MSPFQVFILAADNVLYEGPCESLIVPTSQGQYGILANHSNMISAVIPGACWSFQLSIKSTVSSSSIG